MARKSNKGRNQKGKGVSSEQGVTSDAPLSDGSSSSDSSGVPAAGGSDITNKVKEASNSTTEDTTAVEKPKQDVADTNIEHKAKQGDIHLYPVTVKTQGGEKIELQLSPGDSVMDVRQFLLDAPETCFVTCYDLLLHTKDGSIHHLEDYNEISEVADVTAGDCFLEMVAAFYDDRSIRAHVHRTRELLSLSTLHSSLSTYLALEHEMGQSTSGNTAETSKNEIAELENLGFMDNVPSSLSNLFLPASKEIQCVESIVFSSFNPPPSYRRLSGDLIYLDVVTLDGNKYCITGTTKSFYVNLSNGNVLDPRASKSAFEATTLVGLLQKISSKFKKAFREILERKASAHPFENVQSLLPPTSWLGLYPIPCHKRDAARAENALTLSFGSELIGMQRDWNEELQSCREFPHSTDQERIMRDRALYKVTSDFVDAATNGAIGVINRCIPPINPTDPECFHMYVHNNIFFSFAVDADTAQLSKKKALDAYSKTENIGLKHDSSEMIDNNLPNGGNSISDKSGACNAETINSVSDLAHDVPAETQLMESEQATYASANNDLKGTKAYQEADVSGLYNLAMAIIDFRGHRVVAQSVLPGILQGDKSDSLLYGSVDNGKKICWSEEFHSKVAEAAKRLHLKEHSVLDRSGNVFKLAAPVECKGIVGSDDRHYLLDLMRVTPRDANYDGPGSRFCILRPELITAFCHAKAAEKSKSDDISDSKAHSSCETLNCNNAEAVANNEGNTTIAAAKSQAEEAEKLKSRDTSDREAHSDAEPSKSCDTEAVMSNGENATFTATEDQKAEKGDKDSFEECGSESGNKDTSQEILFNPNVFTEFKLAGSPEEIAADEENVRSASLYLKDVVLPKFIEDLCTLEVSPMDGQTLTEALHANGINVRYIGKVAEGTRHMPHLWDLCLSEIVARSAKHILKDILRDTVDHDLGRATSLFFNCLFGNISSKSVAGLTNNRSQKKDHVGQSSFKSSKGQAKLKNLESIKQDKPLFLGITSDSLWSDIQEFAKLKYQFDFPEDIRFRAKKIPVIRNLCEKVGITVAARKYDLDAVAPFEISDILNLQPVVKHAIPISSEAKDLVETGKIQLAEGMLNEAYTSFSEAFTKLQQVTGPMHREVANCCRYLAMVLYHAGDMGGAIMQQHKELIINERCLGLDHPDTAHSYGNMALFYHGLNQTELALRHMSRALLLLSLSSGPDHPDVAATFINVAMMYQDMGKMNTALRYLQEALKKNERLLGEEHIQTAVCYHALAITFNCMGAFKLSHQHEKKTYDILVKQLGEEDSRTRDSQNWMKTFKMRELQMNAQKQKGLALNAASAQKAMDILKANPNLLQAFQVVGSSGTGNKAISSIIGDNVQRGRGVDERAARAAAEVRKKAAARGLLIRQHGVPVQALPPLTQLLNMINSNSSAANGEENDVSEKEAQGGGESKPGDATAGESNPVQAQTPVGLGAGLKQKKSKGTS